MDSLQQLGEGLLLAAEGQRELAHALAAVFRRWGQQFRQWQRRMPVTLPPTEWRPR